MSNNQVDRRFTQTDDAFIVADLQQMSPARNYNQWIYSMITPFVGKRVLEVGAGIGNLSKKIIKDTDQFIAVEPNPNCQQVLKKIFINDPRFTLIPKRIEECNSLKNLKGKFDTILCVNVLEHIQDDHETLKVLNDLLVKNGYLVLIVPAVKWAYGTIDISVGHQRRYSKYDLQLAFYNTSYKIEKMYYFNFPGLLGWYFNSRFLKIQSQRRSQISFFDQFVPIIIKLESIIHPLLGMSLFVAGRKE
jgi:SAM-dependent methyltransferase